MITAFDHLNNEETLLMFKAPVLVTILVAGADNKIDRSEIKKASLITRSKVLSTDQSILDYYEFASEDFEDKLKISIHDLPHAVDKRNQVIANELIKLNEIFIKLDTDFAFNFYQSLKVLAKKIAQSSGGIFGFRSISKSESMVLSLSMLENPLFLTQNHTDSTAVPVFS